MTDALEEGGRRYSDHFARWRIIFTPQATSLLLVIAVLLLSYVTVQSKESADGARRQATSNQKIVSSLAQSNADAEVRQEQAAVRSARLAADSVRQLLAQTDRRSAVQDQRLVSLLAELESQLTVAIEGLERAVVRLQEQERRNHAAAACTRPAPQAPCKDRR